MQELGHGLEFCQVVSVLRSKVLFGLWLPVCSADSKLINQHTDTRVHTHSQRTMPLLKDRPIKPDPCHPSQTAQDHFILLELGQGST